MVKPLREAMMHLATDEKCYRKASLCCAEAFEKFSMPQCVDAYLSLYIQKGGEL
jgi:hypothetical protein